MVITEKDKKRSYRSDDDNLTQKEADLLLKNSNFAKQPPKENNIPIIPPEVQAKPKPFNKP